VVVDTYQKPILEALEPRSMDTVAFENDGRLVAARDSVRLKNLIGEWKGTVNTGYAVMQHNIRMLAHRTQDLAKSERGADRIAIRTGVRSQHESFALSDLS